MSVSPEDAITDAAEFWETRYLTHRDGTGKVWSGNVNAAIEREVKGLTPGTALELGSGEGADALWLAGRGWSVTAIDISTTALAVGQAQAAQLGLTDRIEWVHVDLATWRPQAEYDLVTSAFFHAPFDFPREAILRRAASAVSPGGSLLIVGHGGFPPGSNHEHDSDVPPLPSPDEVLMALDLPAGWVIETKALVERTAHTHDGMNVPLVDTVLRMRRGFERSTPLPA